MKTKLRTKSVLSYYGSDSEVAADLAAMLDHCKHVTIPFCGGMSILPHLKAIAIVANDLHEGVTNFCHVLKGVNGAENQERLIRRCESTLSHPGELGQAETIYRNITSMITSNPDSYEYNRVHYAWAFWTMCWVGRKGKGGTKNQGGMPSVRRTASGGTNASRIRAAANDLEEWARQFERCEFESVCFRKLLPNVADQEDCGIYLDPCWVGAGDKYLHSFAPKDHRDLAKLLRRFERTAIVMRYGDDPMIRELYADWNIIEASSRTQAGTQAGEVWITRKGNNDGK